MKGTLDNSFGDTSITPLLEGKWLRAARLVWILLAVSALFGFITSLPGYAQKVIEGVTTIEEVFRVTHT